MVNLYIAYDMNDGKMWQSDSGRQLSSVRAAMCECVEMSKEICSFKKVSDSKKEWHGGEDVPRKSLNGKDRL